VERAYSDEFVVDAIATLEDRPAFAEHVRELVCSSRRAAMTRKFLTALGGGVGGGIEVSLFVWGGVLMSLGRGLNDLFEIPVGGGHFDLYDTPSQLPPTYPPTLTPLHTHKPPTNVPPASGK
jgi:hypothetical protein